MYVVFGLFGRLSYLIFLSVMQSLWMYRGLHAYAWISSFAASYLQQVRDAGSNLSSRDVLYVPDPFW